MLVELENITKRLGKFCLEDISMQLPEGYILGLIGPNGAGKTTLLHVILGLYQPNAGRVTIDGMSYADHEVAIREETGVVLLEDMFDGGLTLTANGERYGKFFKNYSGRTLETYLERFGLKSKCRYRSLSRGEKLKFQFAFALAHDAKLLVLDEPTGNLDPENAWEIMRILNEINMRGTTVVVATHAKDIVDAMKKRVVELEKGKITRDQYRGNY